MEYIYAALLLHKAGKAITEASLKSVLKAAGVEADDARCKAVVAALDGVNIEEAVSKAAMPVAVAAAPAAGPAEKKKDDKPEVDEKKAEESAAAGLGALFG